MCLLDHILTISDSEKKKAVEKKRVLDILIVGLDAATFSALILQPIFFCCECIYQRTCHPVNYFWLRMYLYQRTCHPVNYFLLRMFLDQREQKEKKREEERGGGGGERERERERKYEREHIIRNGFLPLEYGIKYRIKVGYIYSLTGRDTGRTGQLAPEPRINKGQIDLDGGGGVGVVNKVGPLQ